jgi:TRAP-type C4-dicarboxylate transport system permease small subunit
MSAIKMVGVALVVCGVLGLMYGGFTYTKESHDAKIGGLELSIDDNETVNIPVWAGIAAIVAGGIAVLVPLKS